MCVCGGHALVRLRGKVPLSCVSYASAAAADSCHPSLRIVLRLDDHPHSNGSLALGSPNSKI